MSLSSFTLLPDEGLIYIYDGSNNYFCILGTPECTIYLNTKEPKLTYNYHTIERLLASQHHSAYNIVDFRSWLENNGNENRVTNRNMALVMVGENTPCNEDKCTLRDTYWRELSSVNSPKEHILLSNILMYRIYRGMSIPSLFKQDTQINSVSEANNQIIHRYKVPINEFNQEKLEGWINLGLFKKLDGYVYIPDLNG